MLGFGAVGRYAIGQIPTSLSFVMVGDAASFSLTGLSANANVSLSITSAPFVYSGVNTPLNVILPAGVGGYILTGLQVTFVSSFRRPLYLRGSYWKGAR